MSTTLTLKNIPGTLHRKLKRSAGLHRRSLNSEIIALLDEAVAPRRRDPGALLAAARALRSKTGPIEPTRDFIAEAKREGRP